VFVWKNVSLADFVAMIRQAGKSYRIFPSVRGDADKPAKFSEADKRILQMLAEGKSTREIAAALYLGYGTVRLYISHMYSATGFSSRAQLVAYALRCGLIDPT
jgi:two-component system response regulator DesR